MFIEKKKGNLFMERDKKKRNFSMAYLKSKEEVRLSSRKTKNISFSRSSHIQQIKK